MKKPLDMRCSCDYLDEMIHQIVHDSHYSASRDRFPLDFSSDISYFLNRMDEIHEPGKYNPPWVIRGIGARVVLGLVIGSLRRNSV